MFYKKNDKKIIIGNWKTNKNQSEVKNFFQKFNTEFQKLPTPNCTFGIAPVAIHLQLVRQLAPKQMLVVAQDADAAEKGAFTGTVSWSQLKDIKVKHAIIGHSERRLYYNETDQMINKKVQALLENKMIPILCIGESLAEFNLKKTNQVCIQQIRNSLKNVSLNLLVNLIVAYEPIWAIGTGKVATAEMAQATIRQIRVFLSKLTGANIAKRISILYGGSINSENVEGIINQPDIDGLLVGKSSLSADEFIKLLTFW